MTTKKQLKEIAKVEKKVSKFCQRALTLTYRTWHQDFVTSYATRSVHYLFSLGKERRDTNYN